MSESIAVSYMGTKTALLDHVVSALPRDLTGPILDLFSGTCALTLRLAKERTTNVWLNDAQLYSAEFARAHFLSMSASPQILSILPQLKALVAKNCTALYQLVGREAELERRSLKRGTVSATIATDSRIRFRQQSDDLHTFRNVRSMKRQLPFGLFTTTYAGTYIGVAQAIELDSLRYAVDYLLKTGRLSVDEHRWCLLAAARVLQRVATTTGHFAQFLVPNENYVDRYCMQRRRSVLSEFVELLSVSHEPIGTGQWRGGNRVYQGNALSLLESLASSPNLPQVIFADPPYTKDQYSRYYHLLETLIAYDYPEVESKARYRHHRFVTAFSHQSGVVGAFNEVAKAVSDIGSTLVLTYPRNGLLQRQGVEVEDVLGQYFRSVRLISEVDRHHSTMGSSKGSPTQLTRELIFQAA